MFGGAGNLIGAKAELIAKQHYPAYIGGPAPNPNLGVLLQHPSIPNPLPGRINTGVSTSIGGIPSLAPPLFDPETRTTKTAPANPSTP